MVEHPEVRQGIVGLEELMQAGAMEGGFAEAAAEVGSVSLGPVDHLDLHKRDLDFGGSYACNKRCLGGVQCEGAAVGGFTIRHHDHASNDEGLLQVGKPGRRRLARGMREHGRAQRQTAALVIGIRLWTSPCLVDQSQATFDEDRLSVAAFGLTAHGKHFLALFPETLGGPFRDILQHIGLSLVDRGVPARIDDRIPFIDLREKDLCARVKRGNRNRNKATGEPVIGGAADEAVETSSFCNGSDVLGLGVEVFDGNAENMGNLMRTREARIKRNVGLQAFELDAMSQLLRRVSRLGGAACQKKRNLYGDRKDKSFCGHFVISVGCGGPAES